ncbi:MAG: succinate dehydrogenase, hydrophobic membrane anchor protein [Pseudomonadota bacterium]|jgi:succinate dehydrogenase / fumarate reductase membrane anchor subunit|nr:MAG: succinate dehydrogenase, hydrophobic membrane anchor protein [Pseudomonadota bacterium]
MSNAANALTRVLGLGSAHEGAHHWRTQRLTALALLLLGPWLLVSLLLLPDLSFATLRAWVGGLVNASLLLILVVAACWHSQLGVQVVAEDYTRGATRIVLLIANAFVHIVLAALGVLSILRLALGA